MKKTSTTEGVRRVRVAPDDADRRLDNFLIGRLKGLPRSRVYRMIRGGEVRVNGGRAKPDRRLKPGDEVRIPPVTLAARVAVKGGGADTNWIERHVIYEDDQLLVLNKPSGLAVHGGSGISLGAIEQLRRARGNDVGMELVHRLDRDTSGCLLVAKKRSALRRLHEQFRAGDVDKQYLALVVGRWSGDDRTVRDPLTTSHRRGGERHVRVDPDGKPSTTRFIPERQFPEATLLRAILETGRTHQIRVHAAHIGHPVAGDSRYGDERDPVVQRYGLNRLFLHAVALAFESPAGDRIIRVDCPLDSDLEAILTQLAADR